MWYSDCFDVYCIHDIYTILHHPSYCFWSQIKRIHRPAIKCLVVFLWLLQLWPVPYIELYNRKTTFRVLFDLRYGKFAETNIVVFRHSHESWLFDLDIFIGYRFIGNYSRLGIGNKMKTP